MRTLGTFLMIAGILLFGATMLNRTRWASHEQLEDVRKELRDSIHVVSLKTDRNYKAIDSLREELAELKQQLETMQGNQDSLKKGQMLIYGAIKQMENQPRKTEESWYDKLEEFFTPKTFQR